MVKLFLTEEVISQEGVVCPQEAVTRPNCAVQFSPSRQPFFKEDFLWQLLEEACHLDPFQSELRSGCGSKIALITLVDDHWCKWDGSDASVLTVLEFVMALITNYDILLHRLCTASFCVPVVPVLGLGGFVTQSHLCFSHLSVDFCNVLYNALSLKSI